MAKSSHQKRQEQREKIEEAVAQLETDSGWRQWIKSHRTLDRFSFSNRLLVMLQVPGVRSKHINSDHLTRTAFQVSVQDAPYQVQTYNAWKRLGRQVKKGEKCVMVIQPKFINVWFDKDGNEVDKDDPRADHKENRLSHFVGLSEFDITQTTGDIPVRPKPKPIEGDDLEWVLPILVKYAEDNGYSVDLEATDLGKAYGSANYINKKIKIRKDLSKNYKVQVLIHEIAHTEEPEVGKKLDYVNYTRNDAEVIVETVSMMVCEFVGLDTSGSSIAYLTNWKRPDDKKVFQKFAKAIDTVANKIEDVIREAQKEESEEELLEAA